jgi:hypothetical protein
MRIFYQVLFNVREIEREIVSPALSSRFDHPNRNPPFARSRIVITYILITG